MKIIFLGTGSSHGIPIIGSNHPVCHSIDSKDNRLRSSILIEKNNKYFLIDCSPDFRLQMLNNYCENLDAILITHEHYDHIGGLEDIRPINDKKENTIPVYGLKRVLENLKLRLPYVFSNKIKKNNTLKVSLKEIDYNKKYYSILEFIKISPLFIWHGNLPILGFRIKNLAYITDASIIPIKTIHKLKGLDILIINIFKIHPFSLSNTLNIIKIISPKKTFLTHISYLFGFHKDLQKKLPKNIHLAYDGLVVLL
ncbi:MBL fold metallo-hydrolase [Blattabacterium cuenoti]|uniref:MBL fold metallo-hydrolase n=1 Tax=Blattabacterium cuenoti TaxID=1653831 RepID=UPI00163C4EB2|nr:MBL fold metallo-hydrolase [Blattabacterium cuenoti]